MEITYQPVLDLRTGRIVKCEALCRPPEAGVDLGTYVYTAEMNGSLRDYTERVFDAVFADWKRDGSRAIDLSVNLTVADLAELDLGKRVEKSCKRHKFDLKRLWFEIDDRAQAIVDPIMLASMDRLASLGVRFSIDSFGDELTQATLYELQSIKISEVKIDGRYVRDADENMRHRNVISAVVALGCDLRIAVAAKSIEREAIAALMVRMGVSHGQGYYFARPTSAGTIAALVERMALVTPHRDGR